MIRSPLALQRSLVDSCATGRKGRAFPNTSQDVAAFPSVGLIRIGSRQRRHIEQQTNPNCDFVPGCVLLPLERVDHPRRVSTHGNGDPDQ